GSGNYALAAGSGCAGKGSSITSVAHLVGLTCGAAQAAHDPALMAMSAMEGIVLDEPEAVAWSAEEAAALRAMLQAETGLPEGIVEMGPFDSAASPAAENSGQFIAAGPNALFL